MVYSMRSGLLSREVKWYFIALKYSLGYVAALVSLHVEGAVLHCTAPCKSLRRTSIELM